jgi:hypothetical protein
MTREEEILNKAINYSEIEDNFIEYDDCGDVCDDKDFIEKAFIQGAKWADKTMIDKVCDVLWAMLYEQDYNDVVNVASWEYDNLEDFMLAFRRKLEE